MNHTKDATTTTLTSSAVPAQGGVITPKPPKEIGGTQFITGQGFTAQIQVDEPAIVEGRWGTALLTFPHLNQSRIRCPGRATGPLGRPDAEQ